MRRIHVAQPNTNTDTDPHADPDTDTHADADTDPDAYADAFSDADADTFSEPESDREWEFGQRRVGVGVVAVDVSARRRGGDQPGAFGQRRAAFRTDRQPDRGV